MLVLGQVIKSLVSRPWYAGPIVAVMAIAYALLTAVFAVVDGVLFKPLGYPDESRLISIRVSSSRASGSSVLSEELAAWAQLLPSVPLTGFRTQREGAPPFAARAIVQANFFDVVGIGPAIGGFSPGDFEASASGIEPRILTDEVFRSQFGGNTDALGQVVILDPASGYGYRVVGVMPKGFTFPSYQLPIGYLTTNRRDSTLPLRHVVGRLPAHMSTDEVRQRVLAAATARNDLRSSTGPGLTHIDRVEVERLSRTLGAASRPLFTVILVAAGILVAVAALNVSSLMAARSLDRRQEMFVRRALGASRRSIGRLVFTEAALLVTVGTMIGLMIAVVVLRFTRTLLPDDLVLLKTPAVDWRVVAFAAMATAVIGSLLSVWPLRLARLGGHAGSSTRNVAPQARQLSGRLVVSAQVTLAVLLTIGGTLLAASLLSVYWQKPAIEVRNTLTIAVRLSGQREAGGNRLVQSRVTRASAVVERLKQVPGVEAAAMTAYDLLDRAYVRSWFTAPAGALNPRPPVMLQAVTGDFYRVLEPHIVDGRFPTAAELARDEPLIVVSRAVARNYWPGASALGQTLTDQGPRPEPARSFTVVGVIEDIRWLSWDEPVLPMIYGPYALLARQASAMVLIRRSSDRVGFQADVLRAVTEPDPFLLVGRVAPLRELFVDSVRPRRFLAWIFGSFAVATLCVVVIGIFGQLAMSTARRTREVGIRITCGATRGGIMRLIVAEQLKPVFAGLLVGGIAAAWSVRFVRSYLYQVTAFDPRLWAVAIGLILATAIAGMAVPAFRASRTDPTRALRAD